MTKMMAFIEEQPAALDRLARSDLGIDAFARVFKARRVRKVWLVGSGTSLYAAMIAAQTWEQQLGLDCEAISPLEFISDIGERQLGPDVLVAAISQSGASFMAIEAVRRGRAAGCLTLGITAEPTAMIGSVVEFLVETHTGPEDAMGKTKGFSTTALAACMVGLAFAGHRGPDLAAAVEGFGRAASDLIQASISAAPGWVKRLTDIDSLFVIGSGSLVPAAHEGGLKVLEVAKLMVATKELEEMLHGPFNAVGPRTGFVLLAGTTPQSERVTAFLKGVEALGSPLVTIAEPDLTAALPDQALPNQSWDLVLPRIATPDLLPILAVIPLQVLAHDLAAHRQVPVDTARYPFLYKILAAKSIYVS